ncbi:MAG: hypothetical protein ABL929_03445 [Ferruginibacter sp.]|nr:hypothetical protein [Ferruginibacter sp.]
MGLLQIIILLTLLASLTVYIVSNASFALKTFPFFLAITFFAEIIGKYIGDNYGNNHLFYSIFTTLIFLYFGFFFYNLTQSKIVKTLIKYFSIVYPILVFANIIFIQGVNTFHTYTYVIGSIFLIFLCLFYLKSVIANDNFINNYFNTEIFICLGLLIFYTFDILFTASINTITTKNNNVAYTFMMVMKYLNYAMYIIIALGFLFRLRKK